VSVREKDFEFIFEGVETLSEDALQSGSRRPEKFRCNFEFVQSFNERGRNSRVIIE